jgi:hypothetical protein
VVAEGEACEICGSSEKRLGVDHCHKTGNTRGVLCLNCNSALGMINDDPSRAERMASYLRGEL